MEKRKKYLVVQDLNSRPRTVFCTQQTWLNLDFQVQVQFPISKLIYFVRIFFSYYFKNIGLGEELDIF